jgi:hypothetical protein
MLQASLNKLKLANRIVKCALRYAMAHNAYHGRVPSSVPYTVCGERFQLAIGSPKGLNSTFPGAELPNKTKR